MNCDEFRAAVLSGDENAATEAHMESCPACRGHVSELRDMRDVLGEASLWEEPSPELGDQVRALITSVAHPEARTRTGWRLVAMAAAAVAAVVVMAGSFLATRGSGPDWKIALPATDLAPGAVATVSGWNEEAGTRMLLSVDGLAPAPPGHMYEFWLSDGPVHVSAGTFRSGGEVEMWAGVVRADFPRLWVTLEPIDDDESPSAETILDTGPQDV